MRVMFVCFVQFTNTRFIGNRAVDGGALYVGTGSDCFTPEGCFSTQLNTINATNNMAQGGSGGVVYWTFERTVQISTCAGEQ